MTDSQSVKPFFPCKMVPSPSWNASDFVLQLNFNKAHFPGKKDTTPDFLTRSETDPSGEFFPNIEKEVPTQANEVNIESTGKSQEDNFFFFHTDEVGLLSKEQLWQHKKEKRKVVHTELHFITVSHRHKNYKNTNALMHNMEPFNKVPRILIEQDTDSVLFSFKKKPGLHFDEEI